MRKIVNILTIALMLTSATAAFGQKPAELVPVSSVDIDRYAGRWYEIAKYPNKFQKQCTANTTANYTQKGTDKIVVINECLKADGTVNRAMGEARIVDRSSNAKLKVRFAPSFLSFLPSVWGDYWVLDLGPEYSYSIVGEPEREYLWILSREPEMQEAKYQAIMKKVEELGFDPSRLERTPEKQVSGPARTSGMGP